MQTAINSGDYAKARRIVDANLDRPEGKVLHQFRTQILSHVGTDKELVAEVMDLMHGKYDPYWLPDSRILAPALEAAVRLGRAREADELATWIIAHKEISFSSIPGLDVPTETPNPSERLAFAYLILAYHALWDGDEDRRVAQCQKAQSLAPDSVPVVFELASAYHERGNKGDEARSIALLRSLYRSLPVGVPLRRDIRVLSSNQGIDVAGPTATTTLQEDLGEFIKDEQARQAQLKERRREERRAREAARSAHLNTFRLR